MTGLKKYKVPFIRPDFPDIDSIVSDYKEILKANWFTNFGPFERRFSQNIASYIGPDYFACTFSSATTALMASILAILGKGDGTQFVIMPSFTFVAGAQALEWCGYRPLLIDIEDEGFHMDIAQAASALDDSEYKNKVKGILFCNAFGTGTPNIEEWENLADSRNLPLIIDSAAGFGSLYSFGRKVGAAGLCEIFSFHATKPFSIGEGGATVSRDGELIKKLESIQNFGFSEGGSAKYLGFNGKLEEINAAIGLRQLERFDRILEDRRKVLETYRSKLNPNKFRLQENASQASLCFASVIVNESEKRDDYLAALRDAGVEARKYYSPSIHKQDYFKGASRYGKLDVTESVDSSMLSLPIHDNMLSEDVELIIRILNS